MTGVMKREYTRGAAEAEAAARAINAEPWEPIAGLVKRQCPQCRYWFAVPPESAERRCLDCARLGTGRGRARVAPAAGGCSPRVGEVPVFRSLSDAARCCSLFHPIGVGRAWSNRCPDKRKGTARVPIHVILKVRASGNA